MVRVFTISNLRMKTPLMVTMETDDCRQRKKRICVAAARSRSYSGSLSVVLLLAIYYVLANHNLTCDLLGVVWRISMDFQSSKDTWQVILITMDLRSTKTIERSKAMWLNSSWRFKFKFRRKA